MTIDSFKEIMAARPWHPVEILLNGGETVTVVHEESIWIGKYSCVVVEHPDGKHDFFDVSDVSKVRRIVRRKKAA